MRRFWIAAIIWASPALAQTPVTHDNQYADPTRDPLEDTSAPKDPVDGDGRFLLDVRGAFGKGVRFRPPSDSFALELRARVQAQAAGVTGDGDPRAELMIRRLRLVIGGHALDRKFTYYIQLSLGPREFEPDFFVPLRDAFVTWHAHRDLNLRLGQMKVPFDRQRVVSSSALQLVDRSVVVGELNLDRDVGFQVYGNDLFGWDGRLSYQLGLFGGEGRNRTNTDLGFLWLARLQFAPFGSFDDFVEGDLERSPRLRLAFSVSAGWNQGSRRERSTQSNFFEDQNVDYRHLLADFVLKWQGLSLFVEALERLSTGWHPEVLVGSRARSGRGLMVQAGYFFTDKLEVAGRFGRLWADARNDPNLVAFGDDLELGGGLSYYFVGHNLKWQTDYFVVGETGAFEHRIRTQMQLFF